MFQARFDTCKRILLKQTAPLTAYCCAPTTDEIVGVLDPLVIITIIIIQIRMVNEDFCFWRLVILRFVLRVICFNGWSNG